MEEEEEVAGLGLGNGKEEEDVEGILRCNASLFSSGGRKFLSSSKETQELVSVKGKVRALRGGCYCDGLWRKGRDRVSKGLFLGFRLLCKGR